MGGDVAGGGMYEAGDGISSLSLPVAPLEYLPIYMGQMGVEGAGEWQRRVEVG